MNEVLHALLEELSIRDLNAYFQPVIQLHTAKVLGYETLLRPATYDGAMLAPGILFEQADRCGCLPDLERESRMVALREFSRSRTGQSAGQLLFLNVSAPLLNVGSLDTRHIRDAVRTHDVDPGTVVIEISESSVQETDQLVEFSRAARESGFIIALDGYGTDESHLERIARIRPEIIKIDRSIVQGAYTDGIKQNVLESVVHLAQRIGAVSLAFGVETFEDLLACVRAGVEYGQGFLLGRPVPDTDRAIERAKKTLAPLREELTAALASDLAERLRDEYVLRREMESIVEKLSQADSAEWESVLREWTLPEDCIDSCFITSWSGDQLTSTITDRTEGCAPGRAPFVTVPAPGDTHGSREYIYAHHVRDVQEIHRSEPRISPVTGDLCRTYSRGFTGRDGTGGILCVSLAIPTARQREK